MRLKVIEIWHSVSRLELSEKAMDGLWAGKEKRRIHFKDVLRRKGSNRVKRHKLSKD